MDTETEDLLARRTVTNGMVRRKGKAKPVSSRGRLTPEDKKRIQRFNEMKAPLPWPQGTAEIMIDAMSVVKYCLKLQQKKRPDIKFWHEPHSLWPTRVFMAAEAISKKYGRDRPPSPWKPVTLVYDQPNPKHTASGLKVRSWKNLYKQGPREAGGVTLAWAQTYVDQSAAERYRADREILYMLELLKRDYPDRRQVLVTADPELDKLASRYAEVRHPAWFLAEVRESGKLGKLAVEALMGDADAATGMAFMRLPRPVMKAFQAR